MLRAQAEVFARQGDVVGNAPIGDAFIGDEKGGGTIWGLTWFVLLVGICGMAVDFTDGFRAKTMLQATADATALAGAIDLPDASSVPATAVAYAYDNMKQSHNGTVLRESDVLVGKWDEATDSLDRRTRSLTQSWLPSTARKRTRMRCRSIFSVSSASSNGT